MSDGADLPGLAHFCEHMLFLGTQSYPQEGEFERYVGAAGGSNNAFTAAEETCYYFDVGPDALDGGGLITRAPRAARLACHASRTAGPRRFGALR